MQDSMMRAAMQRQSGGGAPGGMMGASAERIAGGDRNALQRLLDALRQWFGGAGTEDERIGQQQTVDRAALDTAPEATGIPNTLRAMDARKKLYRDVEEESFR